MGEKKTTLFEINIEDAAFEFSPSPQLSGELAEKFDEYEEKGSKLGLFGSNGESESVEDGEDEESGGLFSRSDESEAETEIEETDVEVEEPDEENETEDEGGSGSALALVIGLLFLLVVAAVARKYTGGETEEYEEVELSEYES